jgi:hypothetical protein
MPPPAVHPLRYLFTASSWPRVYRDQAGRRFNDFPRTRYRTSVDIRAGNRHLARHLRRRRRPAADVGSAGLVGRWCNGYRRCGLSGLGCLRGGGPTAGFGFGREVCTEMVGSDFSDPGAGGGGVVSPGGDAGAGAWGGDTGGETPGSWANSRSAIETAANAEPPSRIPLCVFQPIANPPQRSQDHALSLNLTTSTVNPANPRDGIRVE